MSLKEVQTQVLEQVRTETEIRLSSAQTALLETVSIALQGPQEPRIVRYGEEVPPKGNIRLIGSTIIEVWKPQIAPIPEGHPFGSLPPITSYVVTQHRLTMDNATCNCVGRVKLNTDSVHEECGRKRSSTRAYWNEEEGRPQTFAEHVRTLHIQVDEDALYNGFYPTIPGDDVVTFNRKALMNATPTKKRPLTDKQKMSIWQGNDVMYSKTDHLANKRIGVKQPDGSVKTMYKGQGEMAKGGTRIKGGRAEWRERTKDMVLYDSGVQKNWDMVRKHRQDKLIKKAHEVERQVEGKLREIHLDD